TNEGFQEGLAGLAQACEQLGHPHRLSPLVIRDGLACCCAMSLSLCSCDQAVQRVRDRCVSFRGALEPSHVTTTLRIRCLPQCFCMLFLTPFTLDKSRAQGRIRCMPSGREAVRLHGVSPTVVICRPKYPLNIALAQSTHGFCGRPCAHEPGPRVDQA